MSSSDTQPVELTIISRSSVDLPTLQAIADAIRHAGISPLDVDAMECPPQWLNRTLRVDAV